MAAATIILLSFALGACKKTSPDGGQRVARFLKCLDQGKSAPPDQRATLVSDCVSREQLFARANCNAAWKTSQTAPPDERWRVIAKSCGAQYCSDLKAPKPELCRHLLGPGPQSVTPRQWMHFHSAILSLDAGGHLSKEHQSKALGALAGVLLIRVPAPVPPRK
ncbi:hypothetical protein KJ865_15470, partial [Myxococcota bacterium]|nr:hypothetical protein [Myxococcota bacterium]